MLLPEGDLRGLLCLYWVGGAGVVVILDVCVALLSDSPFLRDCLAWGKLKDGSRPSSRGKNDRIFLYLSLILNVPKRWFAQFYFFGTVWNAFLVMSCTGVIDGKWLDSIIGDDLPQPSGGIQQRMRAVEPACMLALVMMLAQTTRRLYESIFVSVFSSRARMHVLHYIVGVTFYICNSLSIVVDSHAQSESAFSYREYGALRLTTTAAGVCLFIYASVHQHKSARILASLRSGPSSDGYFIPRGDWFEFVTSPHYFAEILIYIGIGLALDALTYRMWLLVVLFVVVNQVTAAHLSHLWYKRTFANYPSTRRVLIPGMY